MMLKLNKTSRIIIILLVVSVFLTGAFYLIRQIKEKNEQALAALKLKQEEQAYKQRLAGYELTKQAIKDGSLIECLAVGSDTAERCISSLVGIGQESSCEIIDNQEIKKLCLGYIAYKTALNQEDSLKCLDLEIEKYKNECLDIFFYKFDNLMKCYKFTAEIKARCTDIVNYVLASKNKNISDCDKVENTALKADCQQMITSAPADSDKDGLSDQEENSYGTNAFLADSDNDGLNDLAELSKYFTDPRKADTRKLGMTDGEAVKRGLIKAK